VQITIKDFMSATGCVAETAGRRLRHLPYHAGPNGTRLYSLSGALPTMWPREVGKGAPEALVRLASAPSDSLYVGGEGSLPVAQKLIAWLPDRPRERLAAVQNSFVVSLANSKICAPAVVENYEVLRTLIVLQPDVLRFIFDQGEVPNMDRLSPGFALVNNQHFQMDTAA
jgi:hypothetical protein